MADRVGRYDLLLEELQGTAGKATNAAAQPYVAHAPKGSGPDVAALLATYPAPNGAAHRSAPLDPEAAMRARWLADRDLRAEFGGRFEAFAAYERAAARGLATTITDRVVRLKPANR